MKTFVRKSNVKVQDDDEEEGVSEAVSCGRSPNNMEPALWRSWWSSLSHATLCLFFHYTSAAEHAWRRSSTTLNVLTLKPQGGLMLHNNHGGPQNVIPRPAASVSPGSLLDIQLLRPHPRPTESEILGRSSVCVSTSPPDDSCALKVENHCTHPTVLLSPETFLILTLSWWLNLFSWTKRSKNFPCSHLQLVLPL